MLPATARFGWRDMALALIGTSIAASCGGDGANGPVAVRDSAGVRIVENAAPDPQLVPLWTLDTEPRLDVGSLEGSEAETLFRVVDAIRLSDGRVAIANAGTAEVRYFTMDGTHAATVGGQGAGPGEFMGIGNIIPMTADSIAIVDVQLQRLTVLDPNGSHAREIASAPDAPARIVGLLSDGRWLAEARSVMSPDRIEQGHMRPEITYVAVPREGGAAFDTIASFPGAERYLQVEMSGGTIQSVDITLPPFARATRIRAHGEGIVVGTQDHPELRFYGSDGRLRRIVRTGGAARPVTQELLEEYVERRLEDAPEEQHAQMRERMLRVASAEFVPPYGAIAVDDAGNLWVQDFPDVSDEQFWTVYDSQGMMAARITLPPTFVPFEIGDDWILGRELDELDVEHVRIYGIRRSASPT